MLAPSRAQGQNGGQDDTRGFRMSIETVLWSVIFAILVVGGVGLVSSLWALHKGSRKSGS